MRHLSPATLAVLLAGALLSCDRGGQAFRLGGVAPATGEAATYGISCHQGLKLAVAEWNARGGVLGRQIKLYFADDKGDPAEGATVFAKLIEQNHVSGIVGSVMSKVSLAGAPICQAARVPMISPTSTHPKVTEVGGPAVEGCFFTAHYAKDDPRPRIQEFVKRFQAKYHADPDSNACLSYDAACLLLDAVRRANSTDGPAIRDALMATNMEVVSGHVKFDQHRNPVKPVAILQVKEGRFVYRATVQP